MQIKDNSTKMLSIYSVCACTCFIFYSKMNKTVEIKHRGKITAAEILRVPHLASSECVKRDHMITNSGNRGPTSVTW